MHKDEEEVEEGEGGDAKRRRVVECKAAIDRRTGAPKEIAQKFAFDDVFEEDASQDDVFERAGRDAVDAALRGYNSTLFAYGQTGSGKTYTLTGGAAKYEDRGLVPRALSMIFEEITKMRASEDARFTVEVSYVEIYMEQGYDLLATTLSERQSGARGYARASEIPLPRIRLMEDEHGHTHTLDLTTRVVADEAEALDLLFIGDTNRTVAETPLNMASSRSHCVFTVSITRRCRGTDTIRRAKLNLVDLAGSERVSKSRVDGMTLQEAKYINVSLHFLEQVIVALQERAEGKEQVHVPYRNSLMTTMLRDSLGGNCRTVMIATASSDADAFAESVSTCRFAQRVGKISNEVFVNEELDVDMLIARLKEENKRMRVEISLLRQEVARARGNDGGEGNDGESVHVEIELDTDALDTLRAECIRYVAEDGYTLDCGSNVAKIQAAQRTLRDMCRRAERRVGFKSSEEVTLEEAPTASSTNTITDTEVTNEEPEVATHVTVVNAAVDDEDTPDHDAFVSFCRNRSRVAPQLQARADALTHATASARTLLASSHALKLDINRDSGALDALRVARVLRASSVPCEREVALERRLAHRLDERDVIRESIARIRDDIHRIKRDEIPALKRALIHEWNQLK
jgi:kinesin family protein 6/9